MEKYRNHNNNTNNTANNNTNTSTNNNNKRDLNSKSWLEICKGNVLAGRLKP